MKIENLKPGVVIKNYKEMCDLLGETVKEANSKKAQLSEWNRYFSYEKQGHKFIINEVYEVPICKNNIANNTKYIEEIKDILVDYIFHNKDNDNKVIISFSRLINILGLVNDTYTLGNSRKKELSDILNIELKAVYYFYNNTRSEFKRIIERALNNLKNRSVIHYNNIVMIVEKDGKQLNYRKATNDEIDMILDTQRLILEDMNLANFQELFLSGNKVYREFTRKLMLELPRNWQFFFHAYEIVYGKYAIKSEYNLLQRKRELNEKSIDRMTKILNTKDINTTNEKKLIDVLINLVNHDFALDEQLIKLYEERKVEKEIKIKKYRKDIINLRNQETEIEKNIESAQQNYDDRDSINAHDYYNYIKQVKNRSDIFDLSEDIFI